MSQTVIFIDARVAAAWDGVVADASEVFLVDPEGDGLAFIAATLAGRRSLDSIQIVSHGSAGALYLGSTVLDGGRLSGEAARLGKIGASLAADGDLLLFGCNVAAGDAGRAFIEQLAHVTGADVAASTDLTGAAAAGGNWTLEAASGTIEADPARVAALLAGFRGVLDVIDGTPDADALTGTSGADILSGFAGDDTLIGDAGNDTLDGGTGADLMLGGTGDDVYVVDDGADFVSDEVGSDEVRASVDFILGPDIENLTLTGSGDLFAIGNDFVNIIRGNAGNNFLDGGLAADTLIGGEGSDIYVVDDVLDVVVETGGDPSDVIWTDLASYSLGALDQVEDLTYIGSGNFTGSGNALANLILGGAGNDTLAGGLGADTLDGGLGLDTLTGGAGDDTYIVADGGDVLVESVDGGSDTVSTTLASYSLAGLPAIENLVFTGGGDCVGTGNGLANRISSLGAGNDTLDGAGGDDTLDGGLGADTLIGGAGNDTYLVDDGGDVLVESGGGVDWVMSSLAAFSLAGTAQIENLLYLGNAGFTGTGNALDNLVIGGAGDDVLAGGAGADTLDGGAGNDTLDGGLDVDIMLGGDGNDVYIVDDVLDVVDETGTGVDEVRASVDFVLGSGIEKLTLTGGGNLSGTGNELANVIIGNGGNNFLDGFIGADTMIGGDGSDTYRVDNAGDVVSETGTGGDTIQTDLAAYSLVATAQVENLAYIGFSDFSGTGNALANLIVARFGNDRLDGGLGADILIGGDGDDTYVVDNAGDQIVEAPFNGTDTVASGISYVLGAELDNLVLTGAGDLSGTGNGDANVITGNGGDNTLDGAGGADTLSGGNGNDLYRVDDLGDVVEEDGNGVDSVESQVDFTLGAKLENLVLGGSADLAGSGNELANRLAGNAGANRLNGAGGNDTLLGGDGNDTLLGGAGDDTLDGGSGGDSLSGGEGDDSYFVDAGGDRVFESAGEGQDIVLSTLAAFDLRLAGAVEDLEYRGAGDFSGHGNAAANRLVGGAGNDFIDGAAGDDRLDGGQGNDTLLGGEGDDRLFGGDGENTLNGGGGDDTVYLAGTIDELTISVASVSVPGTPGISLDGLEPGALVELRSSGGRVDRLIGVEHVVLLGKDAQSAADDVIFKVDREGLLNQVAVEKGGNYRPGTGDADLLLGGSQDDVLDGLGGDDSLSGAAGNDWLLGGSGNDVLAGGSGNDTLGGGVGDDTMIGGAGDDRYRVDSLGDRIDEAAKGGNDTLLSALQVFSLADLPQLENLEFIGDGNFSGSGNAGANRITGGSSDDTLDGGAGADTLIGGLGDDSYRIDARDQVAEKAGAGSDTLIVKAAGFTLGAAYANVENLAYAGSGDFSGSGNAGDNRIDGGLGRDVLSGLAGADTLFGGAGDDRLAGGTGDDRLAGGSGRDSLDGGLGDDLAILDGLRGDYAFSRLGTGSTPEVRVIDRSSGEIDLLKGIERVRFGDGSEAQLTLADLLANTASAFDDHYLGSDAADVFDAGAGKDTIVGGAGNDTLTGGAGNDVLDGGLDDDSLAGGLGDDFYEVDSSGDSVTEFKGQGVDTVRTTLAGYSLGSDLEKLIYQGSEAFSGFGNELANLIVGSSGDDDLNGDRGNDTLQGGEGNDHLDGGLGADRMDGGNGDDVYRVDHAGDLVSDGGGHDQVFSGVSWTLAGGIEDLILDGFADLGGNGNALANRIDGNGGNNVLSGGGGNDTLNGGLGNDTLTGGADDDTLNGGFDNDVLNGGAGNDTLAGGAGRDKLSGGAGNDVFVFATLPAASNLDTLLDFAAGDRIALAGDVFAALAGPDVDLKALFGAHKVDPAAGNLDHLLVYDKSTGLLWYDADSGGGADTAHAVAKILFNGVPRASLEAGDLAVI